MAARTTKAEPVSEENHDSEIKTLIEVLLRQEAKRREDQQYYGTFWRRPPHPKLRPSERLMEAIQVIKWCIVGICSVMVIALVIGIWALVQLERAVNEVEHDVEQISQQVDDVIFEVEHPFERMGNRFGRDLDQTVGEYFDFDRSEKTQPNRNK